MKKLLTILLVLMMVTASACTVTPDYLEPGMQGSNSSTESETPESDDEGESDSGSESVDSGDEEESGEGGGKVVKPITGAGDFNAGKDY